MVNAKREGDVISLSFGILSKNGDGGMERKEKESIPKGKSRKTTIWWAMGL